MGRFRTSFAIFSVTMLATTAMAADRRISGAQLKIKPDGSQIVFSSKDTNLLFPGAGDDPVTNGATVEIVSSTGSMVSFVIPPGGGKPGWSASTGGTLYKFSNALAPAGISVVKSAALKQGRYVKFSALEGLALSGAIRAVAVRITVGSTRNCALFGYGAERSGGKRFLSWRNSPVPSPASGDCSDASLELPDCEVSSAPACGGYCASPRVCVASGGTCSCVPTCGDSRPTCGGACAAGEECMAGAGIGCNCLPIGTTPCGATGAPTCGGSCVSGEWCRFIVGLCGCVDEPLCSCASGFSCAPGYHTNYTCELGPSCGTYPSCGGSCGDGGVCRPVVSGQNGDVTSCVCAVPGDCDAMCGGMDCPAGQVCHTTSGVIGSCGCGPP